MCRSLFSWSIFIIISSNISRTSIHTTFTNIYIVVCYRTQFIIDRRSTCLTHYVINLDSYLIALSSSYTHVKSLHWWCRCVWWLVIVGTLSPTFNKTNERTLTTHGVGTHTEIHYTNLISLARSWDMANVNGHLRGILTQFPRFN